jgi:hypothetical protein
VVAVVDFRYHLVSIVAVFLALAVGIVVGTTALNGPVLDDLNGRVAGLTSDKRGLEADLRSAQQRTGDEEAAVKAVTPVVAAGRLTGSRVVLVSTPDAPAGLRDDLVPLLKAAGAQVGASVRLRPALLDPANAALLDDLVAREVVPGLDLPSGQPAVRAVAQLAQVLVRAPGASALPAQTARRVLAAYSGEDLVDVDGAVEPPGSLVVLLGGDPPAAPAAGAATDAATARGKVLLALARALDARGGGTVVAGTTGAAQPGGLVAVVRGDNGVSDRVSTVDGADTALGRLAVVLALQQQVQGSAGAYGSGAGAQAPLPSPSPS